MEGGILIVALLMAVLVIAILVAILRWALRINDIIDGLHAIYKKLESIDNKLDKKPD